MSTAPNVVDIQTVRRRRLRVLHLITTLNPGGTERLVLTLCRALAQHDVRTEVAVLTGAAPLTGMFESAGIPVRHLGLRAKFAPVAFTRLWRLLRSGRYDLLHTHLDLSDLYGPFAAPRSMPVISTRHNTDSWRVRRTWKRLPFLMWERAAHRRAAATVAVSGAVRDFLVREEGLDRSRFQVIHNGIDLTPYRSLPSRQAARGALDALLARCGESPLPATDPLVGFVGRLAPQKGVDVLLDALDRCHGLAAVLIGAGPLAGDLRRRVAGSELAARVRFAGSCEPVAPLLPAFDLFAFPSRWEGFGLAAVEAMAAGLPVVASAADGLREVVEDGVTGRLVPIGDAVRLAAAMQEVAGDPQRAALGRAGRRAAFERFSAEKMASEVMALYRRVLPPTTAAVVTPDRAAPPPEARA